MLRAAVSVACIHGAMAVHMISEGWKKDCEAKLQGLNMKEDFTYMGAGGNAFVLQFKGEFDKKGNPKDLRALGGKSGKIYTCMPQGAIVKVYDNEYKSMAEETLKFFTDKKKVGKSQKYTLLGLLNKCGAAAMPSYCVDDPELCMFQAKCAQVPKSLKTAFTSEMCWYVVLISGGEKTLEQCFEEGKPVEKKQFMLFLEKATEISKCFHDEELVHGDFQLKNIMTDDCTKNNPTVKAVDLDGVFSKPDTDEEYYRQPSFQAYKQDLRILIGAENSGGYELTHWKQIKANPETLAAAKEIMKWSDENLEYPDDKFTWADLEEKEKMFRAKLQEVKR